MVAFLQNKDSIFQVVSQMYTEVANRPVKTFHFPTGRPACLFVGYPEEELDAIPETAVESFAGVGYPFAVSAIRKGDRVLDVGSGSGTDLLIAARRVCRNFPGPPAGGEDPDRGYRIGEGDQTRIAKQPEALGGVHRRSGPGGGLHRDAPKGRFRGG